MKFLGLLHLIIWSDHGVSAIRDAHVKTGLSGSLSPEESLSIDEDLELDDAQLEGEDLLDEPSGLDFNVRAGSLLETGIAGAALSLEAATATAAQQAARAQMQLAMGRLMENTEEITQLLNNDATELVQLLEETEETTNDYERTPKDQQVIDKALKVSKKMVDVLGKAKSNDAAIKAHLRQTGDPLVYDDGSTQVDNATDPGKQVGELAEGVAKLAKRRGDKKTLKKAESRVLQHMQTVQRMVDGAQEVNEIPGDAREILDDAPEDEASQLLDDVQMASAEGPEDEVDAAESWEVDELDVEKMDGFTRAKLCETLPSLDCDACGQNASSLDEYQGCVAQEIMVYQKERKQKDLRSMYGKQLDQTVENRKKVKHLKRGALLAAHDALQIWGVHRNWARWTSDPTWPLEALKGEPAKAGWDAFTTDSQAIVTSHINDFQTEAVSIAQEEGMASADTIYQGHLAEHVDAAQELQTGAEELMAQGAEMQESATGMIGDVQGSMAEAQAIQADSMALQAEMQQTSAALQVEVENCQQPVNPLTGASSCDPAEIQRLTTEMDGHRAEAQEISDRASALGEDMQVHSEEAQQMAADAEAMAADAETLKNDALQLKDAALEELTADETLQAVLEELIDCAKRIANRILDLAAETIKSMMRQILALVPDLFFACLEAALDIITGFGWIITAARLSYKLAKFARRKWREWKDSKKQQLCGKEPQLDCCVNNVMSWYDQQVKAQRVTEAEFRADTQSFLAKAQRYPDQCTPWVVTMFSDATDNETLKVLIAREAEATPPSIYTTPARLYGLFGKGFLRRKFPVRLVVSRSSFLVEFPKKKRQKRQRVLRFNALCEDFMPSASGQRDTKGLRVLKTKKKVPMGVVFRFGKGVLGQRTFDLDGSNPCAVAHAMCRAACYRPEKCDDYIDPEGYIGLDSHAARSNEKNLLPLCAPVAGLARANGVKESAVKKETQLGPTALRPFVWQHMFKEGKAQAMSRTEALAYAASVCDQHVIPFWSCGSEECSLCQGVASFYFSSQNPDDWCRSFKLPDSENVSESYARDLGRHFKCNYLAGYLSSTDDQRRLSGRESTMQEVCNARTMCSEQTNLLPQLDMRPGLQKGTDAYADSQCRMCLEFVQRAAAGLRPKNFCKAIPRMYQQQKIFCEGTLEEMMEALPAIKDAQDRWRLHRWIYNWKSKLTGSACDRYCRGWVQRKPSSRETLQNPSPLLLAGEDTLPAPPGKVLETWQSEAAKGLAQSPWLQRALKSVQMRLPLSAVSGPQVVMWKLEDRIQGSISGWEALLKELAWDGSFTQKRIWPRTSTQGLMSKKVREAVFLMLKEATLLRSHMGFIQDILDTKLNQRVARLTAEDLIRRVDLLMENFDAMSQVMTSINPTKAPSKLRRALRRKARDRETVVKCYAVAVERHETYSPIMDELSKALKAATDKLVEARQRGVKYSPKDTGLLDVLTKFYLVLPKEEQTRFTRLKQWLNPFNLFRTRLKIDKLVKADAKDCSFRKVRQMTKSGLWKEFQTCCTERTKQVLGWETNIRIVNTQISKILEMIGYVKGNFVTRNIRKAFRYTRKVLLGIEQRRSVWIEEEAADMLLGTWKDFQKSLDDGRAMHQKRASNFRQLTEEMYTSVGDRGVRRGLFRELRFDVVKRNALKELQNGKEEFQKIRDLLSKLAGRLALQEDRFPELTQEGDQQRPTATFVLVTKGFCEDQPKRRKASKWECEREASLKLQLSYQTRSFFLRSSAPVGCLAFGKGTSKSYFRDKPKGGPCGRRGVQCVCAIDS